MIKGGSGNLRRVLACALFLCLVPPACVKREPRTRTEPEKAQKSNPADEKKLCGLTCRIKQKHQARKEPTRAEIFQSGTSSFPLEVTAP